MATPLSVDYCHIALQPGPNVNIKINRGATWEHPRVKNKGKITISSLEGWLAGWSVLVTQSKKQQTKEGGVVTDGGPLLPGVWRTEEWRVSVFSCGCEKKREKKNISDGWYVVIRVSEKEKKSVFGALCFDNVAPGIFALLPFVMGHFSFSQGPQRLPLVASFLFKQSKEKKRKYIYPFQRSFIATIFHKIVHYRHRL